MAPRRLHHHERMVGDHEIGPARAPHPALDEAFLIMRTGRIHAFPVMVAEIPGPAAAHEIDQPGREITARHVTVAGPRGPARHQAESDRVLPPNGNAAQRLLHIEEAKVVLAALAHDDAPRLQGRVRI